MAWWQLSPNSGSVILDFKIGFVTGTLLHTQGDITRLEEIGWMMVGKSYINLVELVHTWQNRSTGLFVFESKQGLNFQCSPWPQLSLAFLSGLFYNFFVVCFHHADLFFAWWLIQKFSKFSIILNSLTLQHIWVII